MPPSSAAASFAPPALLLGLGARVISDKVSGAEAGLSSVVLLGLWQVRHLISSACHRVSHQLQGVGLLYAVQSSDFHLLVIAGIAIRLFLNFTSDQDVSNILITVITTGVGFLLTDFVTQVLDDNPSGTTSKRKSREATLERRTSRSEGHGRRRVKRRRAMSEGDDPGRSADARHESYRQAMSDITSVDTHSELIGRGTTPLERDVATLRARAALADSERRRYREEKKWALAQGNTARAEQMAWQVKRYSALMKSFQREADAKASDSKLHNLQILPFPTSVSGSNGVLSDPAPAVNAHSSRRSRHPPGGIISSQSTPTRR